MYAFCKVARYCDLVNSANSTFKYVRQLILFLSFYSTLFCCRVIFALQLSEREGEAMRDMFVHPLSYSLEAFCGLLVRFQSASPPSD